MTKFFTLSMSLAAVLAVSGVANAADICKAHDKGTWLSKDDVTKKIVAQGYEVRKIQEEDGCWELKGTKDGKRVEAYFDPVSAELVLTK